MSASPPPPPIVVASRRSRLARIQVEEALAAIRPLLPGAEFRVETFDTPGDRDQKTPLIDPSVPDDFFTRDIDDVLRAGRADLAVHSAKDVPKSPVPGLTVAALLPAADIREALVLRAGVTPDHVRVIGTSSPRRDAEMRKAYPGAETRPLRGTIDHRLARLDAGDYDAVVMAACALDRLGLSSRIHSYLPFEAVPNQGRLALVVPDSRADLVKALRALDVRRHAGLVAIVGAPADAALLSQRAARYLALADVVLHDRLVPDEILRMIRGRAVLVGKTGGGPSTPQAEIHRLLLHEAEKGRLVVRLHGGDPGIYGHLGEEVAFLSAWQIRCDVIPAPTAAQIAAARAWTPLTHRGEGHRVTLVTARPGLGYEEAPMPAPEIGNLAVYMGVQDAPRVADKLRAAGWKPDTQVVVGERLGNPDERIRITTLAHLPGLALDTPAVFLIGVRSHGGQSYTLFTGTDPEAFLKHGPLIPFPMIELEALPIADRAAALRQHLDTVDGILFPSRFAVRAVVDALLDDGDVRALARHKLLAVGPSTAAELRLLGLRADGEADAYGGVRSLAGKLDASLAGRYLYPCSDLSPTADRAATLRSHGVELVPVQFYRNHETAPRALPRLPFDRVLFTSTSAVRAYFGRYPEERNARRTWLAVGPSTLKSLEDLALDAEAIRV